VFSWTLPSYRRFLDGLIFKGQWSTLRQEKTLPYSWIGCLRQP
jgi:hypothetical protein